MRAILIVFVGSGLGGVFRHLLGSLSLRLLGPDFPYGTLITNVAGSAFMGLVLALFVMQDANSAELRLLLTTGLIGGFTTWSTFILDAVALWERGQFAFAISYVVASLILSFTAMGIALVAARHLG